MQAGEPEPHAGHRSAWEGGITAQHTAQLPVLVVPHNLLAESAPTVIAATFLRIWFALSLLFSPLAAQPFLWVISGPPWPVDPACRGC